MPRKSKAFDGLGRVKPVGGDVQLAVKPLETELRAKSGAWFYQTGRRGARVVIEERRDRGNRLELRLRGADGRRVKCMLGELRLSAPAALRAANAELIDPRARELVQQLADTMAAALRAGKDPFVAAGPPAPNGSGPLLLAAGIDLAMPDLTRPGAPSAGGMFSGDSATNRRRRRQALRAARLLQAQKPALTWQALEAGDWNILSGAVVQLIKSTRNLGTHAQPGHRLAEELVDEFLAAGRWLRSAGKAPGMQEPGGEWLGRLKADITRETGQDADPKQPRHSDREAGKLLQAIRNFDLPIEPRFRLAFQLGAELRGGQLTRLRRSHLQLTNGAFNLGFIEVPSMRRKRGATVHLTDHDRQMLDWAMGPGGYLHDLEQAHRSKRVDDYCLFPTGDLNRTGGVSPVSAGGLAVNMKYLSREFATFEKLAGVASEEGRGWYGMRRVLADQCEEVTDDQRTRHLVGGWTTPGMRVSYLAKQKHNPAVQLRVAKARAAARARVEASLNG